MCACVCNCVFVFSKFTEYSFRGGFGNFINQGMAKVWMPYSWSTLHTVPVDLPRGGAKPTKGAKRGRGSIDFAIIFVRANECYSTAIFSNHFKVI